MKMEGNLRKVAKAPVFSPKRKHYTLVRMDAPTPMANMLRHYRKQKGLRQIDVAHRLGFTSPDRISLWEKGWAFPSLTNLFKLSVLYGVPSEELYPELFEAIRTKMSLAKPFESSSASQDSHNSEASSGRFEALLC